MAAVPKQIGNPGKTWEKNRGSPAFSLTERLMRSRAGERRSGLVDGDIAGPGLAENQPTSILQAE